MEHALICDLDGVLRIWDPELIAEAERLYGIPSGGLAQAAFGNEARLFRAVTGAITDQQWRQEVASDVTATHAVDGAAAVDAWSRAPGRVDQAVLDIIRRARQRQTVALLTNATTRLSTDLALLGLDHEIDMVFNTSHLGIAKPDRQVFEHVARVLDVQPRHCVFVDDHPDNVAAARAVGMTGHRFTRSADLARFLASRQRAAP